MSVRRNVASGHVEQMIVVADYAQPEETLAVVAPDEQANVVILRNDEHQTVRHEKVHGVPRGIPFCPNGLAFCYRTQALNGSIDCCLATLLYSPEQAAQ